MIITIVRHGEAADALIDEDRELTDSGLDDISFGSHQLIGLCRDKSLTLPSHVAHSSWRRTTQSAVILEAAFQASIAPMPALLPGSSLGDVDAALTALPSELEHCVLVGHQPMVSALVDYYLGDPGRVPPLSPGGYVSISLETPARGCGTLLFWALPPQYRAYV